MTSSSSTTRNLFERPDLLDNQTRLILSADTKPKRLIRSATRSAGITATRDRSDSAASTSVIQEADNDLLDDNDDESFTRQSSLLTNDVNYDTDIEQEKEPTKDYSSKGLYLDQCRRHGVIPSTHFLRHMDNETLTIRYCGLKPVNIKVMVPSLTINTNITKLDIRDNGLGSRGAVYIAQLLKENEYITELNLANNDIGLQGCKALCRVLRSNRTIRILYLDGNRFNDDCAPFFAEVFSQNEYLNYINLNKNFFENEPTGRLFGQSLAENQTMEEFHLGWNRLRAKTCAYLIKPLVSNARLTLLDLSWNGAALLAAKAIFELLKKNSTLEKLHLDNNQFNTECATYIGKGLAKNETLKLITLNGNPLESSGCYAILRPLMKHPTSQIQIIDLRGIIVNKDFIDLVAELLPILPQLTIKLDFDQAVEYYQKPLVIREQYLSIPHYQALEIYSKYLPRDHPLLSKAYYIAAMTRQNFDTGRKTIDFFDKACVTDYRDSFLSHKWKPFGMKLYKCPRCYKLVLVYNIFGVFHGWSCFACMRKIVTRHPVNPKIDRDLFKELDSLTKQRTFQKSLWIL